MTHNCSEDNCVLFHPNAVFVFCVIPVMFYVSFIYLSSTHLQKAVTSWLEKDQRWHMLQPATLFCEQRMMKLGEMKKGIIHEKQKLGICLEKLPKGRHRETRTEIFKWSALELHQDGSSFSVISPKSCSHVRGPRSKNPEHAVFTHSCHPAEDKQMERTAEEDEL